GLSPRASRVFRPPDLDRPLSLFLPFFFAAPPPTELYTLSLHDALPISSHPGRLRCAGRAVAVRALRPDAALRLALRRRAASGRRDRKSTRLNSSHVKISYAVFCLKKKKEQPVNAAQPRLHAT